MNENIDLTKILKNCPKGWELYSSVTGYVKFHSVDEKYVHIESQGWISRLTSDGRVEDCPEGECIIFPSIDQRDWSKFTAPWYKKDRFDPKTLNAFDKVLVRDYDFVTWNCDFLSYITYDCDYRYVAISGFYIQCIPYNDDTKHLVGTKDKAPEYYRYWED